MNSSSVTDSNRGGVLRVSQQLVRGVQVRCRDVASLYEAGAGGEVDTRVAREELEDADAAFELCQLLAHERLWLRQVLWGHGLVVYGASGSLLVDDDAAVVVVDLQLSSDPLQLGRRLVPRAPSERRDLEVKN